MTSYSTSPEYQQHLRSPEWAVVRRLALEQAAHACRLCGSDERLDVHHRTYDRLGAELLADVVVLCRSCHNRHHQAATTTTRPEPEVPSVDELRYYRWRRMNPDMVEANKAFWFSYHLAPQ